MIKTMMMHQILMARGCHKKTGTCMLLADYMSINILRMFTVCCTDYTGGADKWIQETNCCAGENQQESVAGERWGNQPSSSQSERKPARMPWTSWSSLVLHRLLCRTVYSCNVYCIAGHNFIYLYFVILVFFQSLVDEQGFYSIDFYASSGSHW